MKKSVIDAAQPNSCSSGFKYLRATILKNKLLVMLVKVAMLTSIALLGACGSLMVEDSRDFAPRSKDVGQTRAPWNPELSQLPVATGHKHPIVSLLKLHAPNTTSPGEVQQKRILSVDNAGEVLLWNLESDKAYTLSKLRGKVQFARLSSDNRTIAWVSAGKVFVRSLTGDFKDISPDLASRAISVAFQPGQNTLIIGGADSRVYRWKFGQALLGDRADLQERGKTMERYIGHANVVSVVAYHPFGRVFFSGDWKGGISAWLPYDADEYKGKYDVNIFGGPFFSDFARRVKAGIGVVSSIEKISMDSRGEYLALASQDGSIELWQVRGFYSKASILAHKGRVDSIAISSSGDRIASYGRDQKLRIWKTEPEEEVNQESFLKPQFEFVMLAEARLPGLQELVFEEGKTLIAGTAQGDLLVIDTDQLPKVSS